MDKIKDKIVVIGAGKVGEAIAYTLMVRKQAHDIVLIDVDEGRAKGAALDIAHGTGFYKNVGVRSGTYEECADAKIIIITAGVSRKHGQSRLDLAKINIGVIQNITENMMKYAKNPLVIVVSNPVDLLTMTVQKVSGLPSERVIGSGTSLDTARFRYTLSQKLQVNIQDIKAYIVGEHGDGQVPIYSSANVGGFPLKDLAQQKGSLFDEEKLAEYIKESGAEIIKYKGATFYGVAMAVSYIVESILQDACAIIPVSHVLEESFGNWAGVAISLPCCIGLKGISHTLRIPMNSNEENLVNEAVMKIKRFALQSGLIFN